MNLKNDKDIIIKESDKGGSCVIMDKTFNYEKVMEMLKMTRPTKNYQKTLTMQQWKKLKNTD